MKAEFLEEISKLNDKQQQLLKDTIISDWWGDGSGDVLFIRDEFISIATGWAKE